MGTDDRGRAPVTGEGPVVITWSLGSYAGIELVWACASHVRVLRFLVSLS